MSQMAINQVMSRVKPQFLNDRLRGIMQCRGDTNCVKKGSHALMQVLPDQAKENSKQTKINLQYTSSRGLLWKRGTIPNDLAAQS